MTNVRFDSISKSVLFAAFAAAALTGCGKDKPVVERANAGSSYVDGGFEGLFVSKSFECIDGSTAKPVANSDASSQLKRKLIIVSDHLRIDDANATEMLEGRAMANPPAGLMGAVNRYFEVVSRVDVAGASRRETMIELEQPEQGANGGWISGIGGKSVTDENYHPITRALKNAAKMKWTYVTGVNTLDVYEHDVPKSICPNGGSILHVAYEEKDFN